MTLLRSVPLWRFNNVEILESLNRYDRAGLFVVFVPGIVNR